MAKVIIRPARYGDLNAIHPRIREIERRELAAMGVTAKPALRHSWKASLWTMTAEINDRPELMFGVVSVNLMTGEGNPWMLGTDAARVAKRQFVELGHLWVGRMEAVLPRLSNFIHRDNDASIRWLTRLGFTVDPEVVDIGGEPMRRFSRGY